MDPIAPPPPPSRTRLAWTLLSGVALVVAVVVLLPRLPGFAEARELIAGLDGGELALLLAVAVANVGTWTLLTVAAMPGLGVRRAGMVSQASATVANTLPWGDALSLGVMYAMYTSWGYRVGQIGLAVLAGGGANLLAKLLLPLSALALLGTGEDLAPLAAYGLGAVLLGATLIAALLHAGVAAFLGRGLGRTVTACRRLFRRGRGMGAAEAGWEGRALALREAARGLLRRRGPFLVGAGLANWLTTYAVLLAALRLVGVRDEISAAEALAAFAFAHLVTTLPLPAGGLGVVDLGMQALLAGFGAGEGAALAAILLFRACTYLFPIPIGALAWLLWRVQQLSGGAPPSRRRPRPPAPAHPSAAGG